MSSFVIEILSTDLCLFVKDLRKKQGWESLFSRHHNIEQKAMHPRIS